MPEVPSRLRGILDRLESSPWEVVRGGEERAARAAVLDVHDTAYVDRLERAAARGDGLIDSADTPLSAGTLTAAWAAVETILRAADWVVDGEPAGGARRAFAAVRPPGHHAERAMAMGFCYFNNVAVAAEHLVGARGLDRVAILDFDVHHGNGTQHLFEERSDVFFASLHQHPFYPGTGMASETGRGAGRGATLNVPLAAGGTDGVYEAAFRDRVLPAVREFRPDVLLVSAGFDAWARDPLGGMAVSQDGFRAWGGWLAELADDVCEGRMLSTLEGGYDLRSLPDLVVAYLEGTAGN